MPDSQSFRRRGMGEQRPAVDTNQSSDTHSFRRRGMSPSDISGNAWGVPYVPYDNYLTRLHEGERVLTASEARTAGQGNAAPIILKDGTYHIREDADIDRVAQQLFEKIRQAQKIT